MKRTKISLGENVDMKTRRAAFRELVGEVSRSDRFPKAILQEPRRGENIVIVRGEVSSRKALDDLEEIGRQHGFILMAQEVWIPAKVE